MAGKYEENTGKQALNLFSLFDVSRAKLEEIVLSLVEKVICVLKTAACQDIPDSQLVNCEPNSKIFT